MSLPPSFTPHQKHPAEPPTGDNSPARPAPSFRPAVERRSIWQQSPTHQSPAPPAGGGAAPNGPCAASNRPSAGQTGMPPSFAATHRPANILAAGGQTTVMPVTGASLGSAQSTDSSHRPPRRIALRVGRTLLVAALALLLALGLWVGYLYHRVNAQLQRVDALSTLPPTGGTTTLLAGSDERGDGVAQDGTQGRRSDSILLLHTAPNGQTVLISLPRDSYVQIPGHEPNKLNAAYSFGGPQLLVATVEQLLGIKVDHYLEVGMGGVEHLVDAVGGVELCYDRAVSDKLSGMNWQPGCHHVGGVQALAFSRMRYSDPLGDIGRTQRQRQVISKTLHEVFTAPTFVSPNRQLALIDAGTGAVRVDRQSGTWDMFTIARALRKAGADHMEGTLPIVSYDYRPGRVGSTVKLDSEKLPGFVEKLQAGTLNAADLQVRP